MRIQDQIAEKLNLVEAYTITDASSLEAFRLLFISKKGELSALFDAFKQVPNDQKKEVGQLLNQLKNTAEEKFKIQKEALEAKQQDGEIADFDVFLPPVPHALGSLHPLTTVGQEIIDIFTKMGFTLSDGPEIETDWNNFSALNFAENHPAREMQDTFFVEKNPDILLRTHTSSVQIRTMSTQKPPIRILSVGRVFRNETISARAHCMFHQVEGLYINKKVSFAELKQTLLHFAKELFGHKVQIRMRPSYFPFTEPSAEVDVSCSLCHGKGCNVCKHTGWLEICGAGMVHPNVLKNCGIDPEAYTGFAFGMGIERIVMLKYNIKDLRLYTENDIRFLRQFKI
ncbi:MAG: phenylalanine--tRNA ligase subunit alpha [Cytophagales bacterium]|nr:MAG: phenylalanine--tRNA ligase subunit alpha [Cytophagales bacterium]TAF61464.1 MAG: phenylalanine--tRNA ligase subunit alpha [Cytophagales bacterium]